MRTGTKRTGVPRTIGLLCAAVSVVGMAVALAMAQGTGANSGGASEPARQALGASLRALFLQSVDLFTVLLVTGSIASVAVIIQCVWEVRGKNILPVDGGGAVETIRRLAKFARWEELREYVEHADDTFVSRVVRAGLRASASGADRAGIRDSAELAASEECGRWFRKIEPLNIIGNLGPLLGLAGTVWGMIIAFTSLGQGGGQANPGELSLGISKALFHTLLGLMLAVPSLVVFGFYRSVIDRLCTRAMVVSAEIVQMLPAAGEDAPVEKAGGAGRAKVGAAG